jgi:crotonobetainyl-CoA:carnitine CoA-transferase CaiB-like acyl-CoA transferase
VGDLSARPKSSREPYAEWAARLFDPSARHAKPEALRGIRVLDLSVIIFGPATADFLGELGAEVIKVEMPGQGDVTRILGHAGCFWKDVSVAFFPQNHGKYHVGVDMHHADGQAVIRKLAARSDVVVENFKPGTTEAKWGLGYRQLRELNPRLIYVANTGFGQWGPFAEGRASYDGLAQAVSGLTGISGFEGAPPIKSGNYLGDWFGACLSAMGVLAALRWRDRTGEGQFVDTSIIYAQLLNASIGWITPDGKHKGDRPQVDQMQLGWNALYRLYQCADETWLCVTAIEESHWQSLCSAIGRDDLAADSRFATADARKANDDDLDAALEAVFAAKTATEWFGILDAAAVPVEVSSPDFVLDLFNDPEILKRGWIAEYQHPTVGKMNQFGLMFDMSETPGTIQGPPLTPGMNTREILASLDFDADQIAKLEEEKVVLDTSEQIG